MERLVDLHKHVLLGDVDGLDRGAVNRAATDAKRIAYQFTAAEITDNWHPHHWLSVVIAERFLHVRADRLHFQFRRWVVVDNQIDRRFGWHVRKPGRARAA